MFGSLFGKIMAGAVAACCERASERERRSRVLIGRLVVGGNFLEMQPAAGWSRLPLGKQVHIRRDVGTAYPL